MIRTSREGGAALARPDMEKAPAGYRDRLDELFRTWDGVRARNRRLSLYYNMKNQLKDLGISVPENLLKVDCVVGWCKKAVDAMAVRSVFDGFTFAGAEDGRLSALVRQNRMRSLVGQAVKSSCIHGVATLSVMRGKAGQPAAKVRAFSANSSAVVWDRDAGRVGCGIVLNETDARGRAARYTAHFPDAVVKMTREGEEWSFKVEDNPLGRPMMEALAFDPDLDRPLGHSLLTPEILGIVDKAMRDVLRMEVGAEFFTFPQRYVLGAAEDLFGAPAADGGDGGEDAGDEGGAPPPVPDAMGKFRAYIGALMAISRDENGDIPQVGQFSPSSAENFTTVFENDAQRFSGATNVPLAQLGVLSNNYTSSDALNAANDPLILAVETMNRSYEEALASVAEMMVRVSGGKPADEVQVVWKDPSMPTISARADAWTKFAAVDGSIVGTRTFYEGMGMAQQKIDRLEGEKRQTGAIASLHAIAQAAAGQGASGDDR